MISCRFLLLYNILRATKNMSEHIEDPLDKFTCLYRYERRLQEAGEVEETASEMRRTQEHFTSRGTFSLIYDA